MALEDYRRKRAFARTPEPKGGTQRPRRRGPSFVVQKHAASRLHYDFRLEIGGVLKSWAVPKGPSLDPADKRLAVAVEDHPLEYGDFEGVIPAGEYGGGTVMLWDRGTWQPEGDPAAAFDQGQLKFTLAGRRLKGAWALVRMGGKRNADGKNWLLIKERDQEAHPGDGAALVDAQGRSVASRRTMDGIARAKTRVWRSQPKRSAVAARAQRLEERALRAEDIVGARPGRLPATPRPQLATLADAPPEGNEWLNEIKLDGYRILARIDRGKVRLFSRNGKDWTSRLPGLAAALAGLPVRAALIDGELVHLRSDGVSSFTALKDDLARGTTDHLVYEAFDLLHLDGRDLTAVPLERRKAVLASLLDGDGVVRLSDHVVGNGAKFFAKACALKLEGIVSKRRDAPYRAGRTTDWRKTKCVARDEFVVLGWTDPAGKRSGLGALLLGYYDHAGALRYAGAVGTGFTERTLAELRAALDRRARRSPPSAEAAQHAPRGAHWLRPELVADIQYAEWTGDGRLRHPSFRGLREDKSAADIVIERADAPVRVKRAPRGMAEVAGVRLSHPDKQLYPERGITKLDLARYYETVADAMLPHVRGRPLTLLRCPNGAGGKWFYQKHPGAGAPATLARIEIEDQGGPATYLIAEDVAGLVALVQMGVLEIHVWGSTRRALERPDRLILDLDPDEGLPWERVAEGALAARDLLVEMGLRSFVKATGGKGLHVVAPLQPRHDWDVVKRFSHAAASELVRRHPHAYTDTLSKSARRGKIFVDYLRNQRGATAVAPYSARARPGATVAAPLAWAEVATARGDGFDVVTLPERLARQHRDPWAELLALKQTLPAAILRKL